MSKEDKEMEDGKDFMVTGFLFCVLHLWLAIWTGMSCVLIVWRQTMGNTRKKSTTISSTLFAMYLSESTNHSTPYILCN